MSSPGRIFVSISRSVIFKFQTKFNELKTFYQLKIHDERNCLLSNQLILQSDIELPF